MYTYTYVYIYIYMYISYHIILYYITSYCKGLSLQAGREEAALHRSAG